jgi:uncharacterized protein YuzE
MRKQHVSLQHTGGDSLSIDISTINNDVASVYVTLVSKKQSHISKELGPNKDIILDFDVEDNLVGVELLNPRNTSLAVIKKVSRQFGIPALANLRPKNIQAIFA